MNPIAHTTAPEAPQVTTVRAVEYSPLTSREVLCAALNLMVSDSVLRLDAAVIRVGEELNPSPVSVVFALVLTAEAGILDDACGPDACEELAYLLSGKATTLPAIADAAPTTEVPCLCEVA